MRIDFSTMAVGDVRELPSGTWEETRPIYEQCLAYTRATEPSPQFQFDAVKPSRMREVPGWSSWIVRRLR